MLGVRTDEQLPALNFRDIELHDLVRATVGFQSLGRPTWGGAAFRGGLRPAATFGIDVWLTRRKMRHHNWSIFCVVAVAGSLVGVGAVMLLRGLDPAAADHGGRRGGESVARGGRRALRSEDADPRAARRALPAGLEEAETGDPFGGQVRVLPASDSLSGGDSFVAPESYLSLAGASRLSACPCGRR